MFAVALLVPLLTTAAPPRALFDQVKAAQKCHSQENGSMECDFDLGSLHFGIAGVGDPDAGIAIYKADSDGDFHLGFGIRHGCLIVRRGLDIPSFDIAFVSPMTGGVYRDWPSCHRAGLERRRR
jgi:hypothetical protein